MYLSSVWVKLESAYGTDLQKLLKTDLDFCSVDSIAGHIAVKRGACARGSILARRAQLSRVQFQRNNRFLAN